MFNNVFELYYISPKNHSDRIEGMFDQLRHRDIKGNLGLVNLKKVVTTKKSNYLETKITGELVSSEILNKDGVVYLSQSIFEEYRGREVQEFVKEIGSFVKGRSISNPVKKAA